MADEPQILDLTGGAEKRPTIKLPHGDFKMRLAEELTFAEFAEQTVVGKHLIALGDQDVEDEGVLDELQKKVAEGVSLLLRTKAGKELSKAAAGKVNPAAFLAISDFFNTLARAAGASASGNGSSSAPDASDSSETSATD